MDAANLHNGQHDRLPVPPVLHPDRELPNKQPGKQVASLGVLHAHALAIEREAAARYRELAERMADCCNDSVADLFSRLADFEVEHAAQWAKKSVGVEMPVLSPGDYAWLDCGAPVPEARAFVYRMMTPRLALEIALQAEERARAFFERVRAEARNAGVQEVAGEFARDEESHIAWVKDAIASLPAQFRPSEEQPGNPAITQEL